MRKTFQCLLPVAALLLLQTGCHQEPRPAAKSIGRGADQTEKACQASKPAVSDQFRIVLLPINGETSLDKDIARAQQKVAAAPDPYAPLERLGWLFVAKARASFDPGFYKLAEQSALWMESKRPHGAEALLLRGHVLQNLHRFNEAEPLARQVAASRGLSFDYGLLGDVLMEVGRLGEAVEAYQKMADIKPDLEAYTRIAHVRWLKGDLAGATEMMEMAAQAASPRSPEVAAWIYTRLAIYRKQAGEAEWALQTCDAALQFQNNYPPALLAKGRLLLVQGRNEEAAENLSRASALNPLPEYQWSCAESLRAAGQNEQAAAVEALLKQHGAGADPRTLALFLATRGEDAEKAIHLAEMEFKTRQDVFTHDALAWSLAAGGRLPEARVEIDRALAEGTQDGRLFLHAAIIYGKSGLAVEAGKSLNQARALQQMLLPSERSLLNDQLPQLELKNSSPEISRKNDTASTASAN